MKKEKGMVTRTRSQQRMVKIQPQMPIPVSLSSAASMRPIPAIKSTAAANKLTNREKKRKKKGGKKKEEQTNQQSRTDRLHNLINQLTNSNSRPHYALQRLEALNRVNKNAIKTFKFKDRKRASERERGVSSLFYCLERCKADWT